MPKFSLFLWSLALASFVWSRPASAADPSTSECLTASEDSLKDGNDHALRSERRHLLICAASSCPTEIRKECMRRVEEVNAAMPALVFEAKKGDGTDLTDVKVTMDGEVLADHLDGTALEVDPGKHSFVFETPGEDSITKELVVNEGVKDRRESIVFGPIPAGGVVGPPDSGGQANGGMPTQRVVALIAGGVGVAGLATGGVFGVMAMQKKQDAEKTCPRDCATQDGVDKWHSATTFGTVSTIAFAAGGALVAGAAVLWFTSPKRSAEVGIGPGSVELRGTF
ncbi:MAG TPA: hypothetical protein VNN72_06430 [Polyangiaceae bacterium]|nr:hypothetical protein [Polyangiaceae bacterium]